MWFLMILSRYFVFIHFPKTGGTFVESLLKAHAPSDWDILDAKAIGIQGRSDPNHPTILDIPAEYQKLPIFGFVRNPWDWYVSWYGEVKKDGKNKIFNEASDHGKKGFKETLFSLYNMDVVKREKFGIYSWYFHESYGRDLNMIQFGRFEHLRQDLIAFLKSIKDFGKPLAEAIWNHPPLNVSQRKSYTEYYDNALRGLIASKDQQLIEHFGYIYG